MWKWISTILLVVAVVILSLRIADRLERRRHVLPVLPQPNGYETVFQIAHEVSVPQGDLADLSADAVRQYAQTNQQLLAKLSAALAMESGVPLKTETGWRAKHAEELKPVKHLTVSLGLQSKASLSNNNTNESAQYLIEMISLGQAIPRGGLIIDGLTGLAVETIGAGMLRGQVPGLDATACRNAARELEQLEARRESSERILKTEKTWSGASYGLISRIGDRFFQKTYADRYAKFNDRYQETIKRTRRLMLLLASRAIELETHKRPANTADLVPGVLKAVPLDPVSNEPMTDIPQLNP